MVKRSKKKIGDLARQLGGLFLFPTMLAKWCRSEPLQRCPVQLPCPEEAMNLERKGCYMVVKKKHNDPGSDEVKRPNDKLM